LKFSEGVFWLVGIIYQPALMPRPEPCPNPRTREGLRTYPNTIHHGVEHHHRVVHQLVFFEFLDEFESNHHSSGIKTDAGLDKWCGKVGTTLGAEVSTWIMKSYFLREQFLGVNG